MGRGKNNLIFLDTHIVIWLYDALFYKLSKQAIALIESHDICISPIVKLELQYLFDVQKVKVKPQVIINELKNSIELQVKDTNFLEVINHALELTWTRDPFDRIITSEALLSNAN